MCLNAIWPRSQWALKQLMAMFFQMDRIKSLSFLRDLGGFFGCPKGMWTLPAMPFSRDLLDMFGSL